MPYPDLPDEIERGIARARRLEWWTIFFLATIVGVMYLTLGSSQAMRSAWLEDLLSLLPPALFLFASSVERRPPTEGFPYGFHRVGSLAFFGAALALTAMGGFLVYESAAALLTREHPTIGSVTLFGREVWLGWLMMAALVYSVIPPVILGRLKQPVARQIGDKVLFTDADMNKADWQTGLAAIAGVAGIGAGLWWADAAAAGIISLSVLKDGLSNLRGAMTELLDGAPRAIGKAEIDDEARQIMAKLRPAAPEGEVLMRQTGRYLRALVTRRDDPAAAERATRLLGDEHWRLIEASRSLEPEDLDRRNGAT